MARDIGISAQEASFGLPMSTVDAAQSIVDAILEGGPADIDAAERILAVSSDQAKIKIERLGGYEHFERDGTGLVAGPVVFRWTMRTRMAE